MKKLTSKILVCVLVGACLTGCGKSGGSDQGQYVQGVLDVACGKSTDAYVKATGVSKEDAEKYSEQVAKAQAQVMAAYFGMEEPSDDVLKAFQGCYQKLGADTITYTVKADGDEIVVSIHPALIGGDEVEEYVDDFNVRQFVDSDKDCTDEAFAEGVSEVILAAQEDGDASEEVKVSVTEKDGRLSISDEDMEKLDQAMMQYQ